MGMNSLDFLGIFSSIKNDFSFFLPFIPRGTNRSPGLKNLARMPDPVAPVVEVLEDGRLEIRRSPPLPEGPEVGPWLAAGVVLPRRSLGDLTAVQRAALLSLFNGFSGGARLEAGGIVGLGFAFSEVEMRGLLQWLR